MIIFNRRFTPSWLMFLMMLAGLLLFISLGLWQLDRAAFKDAIKTGFETRLNASYRPLENLEALSEPDGQIMQFEKLIIAGHYDSGRNILIDNQIYRGQAGYHVLTPFKINGVDKMVLVNRGWVILGNSRDELPSIEAPMDGGVVQGIVSIPDTGGFRMGEVSLNDKWPQVIPYVDIDAMQTQFQGRLLPIILWLDPEQTGHYQRQWNPVWADPEKSRAYAWQWFAFAAISLGLFLVLNLHKVK